MRANSPKFYSHTGKWLDPFELQPGDVDIRDIAHALSNLCRFNGHVERFYSVAEHSILVSQKCPSELALAGLLHDAAEAYIGDLIHPIKCQPEMDFYREVEAKIEKAIAYHFNLSAEFVSQVKEIDRRVLETECRMLFPNREGWPYYGEPYGKLDIIFQSPRDAKTDFLRQAYILRHPNRMFTSTHIQDDFYANEK